MGVYRTLKTFMDENYNMRFLIWVYLVSLSDRIGTKKTTLKWNLLESFMW